MIDIHSHIMPGVDDGARGLDESLAMGKMAQADGIDRIVCTPHSVDWSQPGRKAAAGREVAWLQQQFTEAGLEIELLPGVEVYLEPDVHKQRAHESIFGINGSRYLLIEFPHHQYPFYADQIIFELRVRGVVPVIAHPERNLFIRRDPNLLAPLVEKGCLVQLTAASLAGDFTREIQETSFLMLEHNLAHVIATDAHTLIGRGPMLSPAVAQAASRVGRERAEAMVTTIPEAIIGDREITVPSPTAIKAKRNFLGLKI